LCSTPVDLEQREGRIQRFGGLSIRAALAGMLGEEALNRVEPTTSTTENSASPWMRIAELAEERLPGDGSGLSPWWICDGGEPERLFLPLRHSRQSRKYEELKRQRWFYRLALGQPHQEDFIERIERHADLRANFSLNLSAWSIARDSIQAGKSGK
jgi:hypothetical protein